MDGASVSESSLPRNLVESPLFLKQLSELGDVERLDEMLRGVMWELLPILKPLISFQDFTAFVLQRLESLIFPGGSRFPGFGFGLLILELAPSSC